ncbi:hypothetical protein Mal64_04620 [Pseudobythopirellula maris]|uniref:Type VI secretion system component TssM1 N-terminal domain-containing protein n=1 Tax=Pseudobythopirellula maris TaxID=2527991 RepID=A0A5C5ZRE4_9BACT|nr:type VI secretion protein IcmF/TssM N-terminal domain-containing protein [Pseudobythopirellula maris]TWT90079.1 hypothetical protein Mal64_04620 [Pseudobythopirellula maris]
MTAFISSLTRGVLRAAVAPFVSLGRGAMSGGVPTAVVHVLLVVATLVGLWFLNNWLGLDKTVHAPSRLLRELWLPTLFLLGYAIAWVGFWTYRTLSEPDAASPFPDVDRAWRQATTALSRRGVDLVKTPLVMVLGEPGGRTSDAVAALEIMPRVGPLPADSNAPLRVVADDKAVYVFCQEASAVSYCNERLAQERSVSRRTAQAAPALAASEKQIPVALRAGAEADNDAALVAASAMAADADETGTDWEGEGDWSATETTFDRPPLLDADQVALAGDRLEHLMRLVRRDREPTTPISGAAVLVTCDAAQDQRAADAMAASIEHDLDRIEAASGARCPTVAIVSDIQHTPGGMQLLQALTADRKRRRFGVELPAEGLTSEQDLRSAVNWLTRSMAPALCQRLLSFDPNGSAQPDDVRENASLFQFQCEIAQRGDRLQDLLAEGLAGDENGPWPLLGCYLLASGDSVAGAQAFGTGVMDGLVAEASRAEWTPAALAEESHRNRKVAAGYGAVAAAVIFTAVLLVF